MDMNSIVKIVAILAVGYFLGVKFPQLAGKLGVG